MKSLGLVKKYEDIYIFNLNIFDNFIKDLKKQNFIGITLGKYEEPAHVPENIYFLTRSIKDENNKI